jgi:hypothetical protein
MHKHVAAQSISLTNALKIVHRRGLRLKYSRKSLATMATISTDISSDQKKLDLPPISTPTKDDMLESIAIPLSPVSSQSEQLVYPMNLISGAGEVETVVVGTPSVVEKIEAKENGSEEVADGLDPSTIAPAAFEGLQGAVEVEKDMDGEKDMVGEKDMDGEKDMVGEKDMDGEKDMVGEKDMDGEKDMVGEKDTDGKDMDGEKGMDGQGMDGEKDMVGEKHMDGEKDVGVGKDMDGEKDMVDEKDMVS